jgi:hypothetical protein
MGFDGLHSCTRNSSIVYFLHPRGKMHVFKCRRLFGRKGMCGSGCAGTHYQYHGQCSHLHIQDMVLKKNNEKQSIRAVSRQTIVLCNVQSRRQAACQPPNSTSDLVNLVPASRQTISCPYRLQITDYRLAPSKWGAREEPTSAPWATIEDTLSS